MPITGSCIVRDNEVHVRPTTPLRVAETRILCHDRIIPLKRLSLLSILTPPEFLTIPTLGCPSVCQRIT